MKIVYDSAGSVKVEESTEIAQPGPTQVCVDVSYVGICGTDLHIFHGNMDHRVKPPSVIGHEAAGVISAIGSDVTTVAPGQRVTVIPLDKCGECAACLDGNGHICYRLNFIGVDSVGAMQTTWLVDESALVALPEGMDTRTGALSEPVAVAVHDVRRSGIESGQQVLIVGGGPIGFLIGLLARNKGNDVTIVETNPARRELLTAAGIRSVDAPATAEDLIAELTDGRGFDYSFEVSGAPAGMDLALQGLKARGVLTLVAIYPQPVPVSLHRVFWREITIVGARVYERQDFEEAVALLGNGAIPVEQVITSTVPAADVQQAFGLLEAGGAVMKVLVAINEGVN
jgi:(R,R)-butanediol dehydrogenase / meso-butanediol dehydrogenase / diacetyl reductase